MDEHFMAIVGRHSVKVDFYDLEPQILREVLAHAGRHSLLIQATSAPHFGDDLSRFVVSMQRFSGGFVDLVYGADSALYRAAKNLGIRCQNGLPMLIEQARLSQECWWGRSVEYQAIEDHLLR
jgi:shikimate 5-dehydrogenase